MALSSEQIKKYNDIKDAVTKSFKAVGTSSPQTIYHGMANDVLRVSIIFPTKFVSPADKTKIVNILKKFKMVKIKEIHTPAIGGGITWSAFDQ